MNSIWKIGVLQKKFRHIAIKAATSEPVRELHSWLGLYSYRKTLRQATNGIVVDISGSMGMGALISKALLLYAFAEREGIDIAVVCSCPLYSSQPDEDVFATFFEPTAKPPSAVKLDAGAYRWAMRHTVPKSLELAQAAALLHKHFQPSDQLRQAISTMCKDLGPFDLSIHYRGTDKVLESGEVPYEKLINEIRNNVIKLEVKKVFLATDDPHFETHVKNKFPELEFFIFNLGEVEIGVPRHFSDLKPNDKALEALVNCYMIASTPVCIRTSSYLSSMSKIVNPALRTITVNRTKAERFMFPEDMVLSYE